MNRLKETYPNEADKVRKAIVIMRGLIKGRQYERLYTSDPKERARFDREIEALEFAIDELYGI